MLGTLQLIVDNCSQPIDEQSAADLDTSTTDDVITTSAPPPAQQPEMTSHSSMISVKTIVQSDKVKTPWANSRSMKSNIDDADDVRSPRDDNIIDDGHVSVVSNDVTRNDITGSRNSPTRVGEPTCMNVVLPTKVVISYIVVMDVCRNFNTDTVSVRY